MATTWILGTTEDGLIIQVTAEQNDADVNFEVEVLEGSAHINALYWSDGDEAANESSYSDFVNIDGSLVKREHSVNMNGTGVTWDGGHLISLPGLKGGQALGVGDDPIEFTVSGVTIDGFQTIGVRAASTSTEEGSIKWVAQPDVGEPDTDTVSEVVESLPAPVNEGAPEIAFFPTQHGNSHKHVGVFSVMNSDETFTFTASVVDSADDSVPSTRMGVDSATGSLSFGRGANGVEAGTYQVTVTATGSEDTVLETTFTVLLGDGNGNPGDPAPGGAADTMPSLSVLYVLDSGGKNILLGMNGNDSLTGGDGVDYILGGNHNDAIDGGGGNDVIWGGNGADTLSGGAGDDIFAYLRAGESSPGGSDTITDWADGINKIHLAFIDADTVTTDDQAFVFVATQNSAIVANSITWHQSGGNTIIQGDVNGNTTADLYIVLTGLHTLTAADFIL